MLIVSKLTRKRNMIFLGFDDGTSFGMLTGKIRLEALMRDFQREKILIYNLHNLFLIPFFKFIMIYKNVLLLINTSRFRNLHC